MARILIVDDEAPLRESLAYALTREGHGVVTAEDGGRGLAIASAERFDVLILDLMLPVMNGMDLCREIRRSSSVPIIMLTARDTPADTIEGLGAGADHYVSKPFNTRELLARIAAVLRRHEPVERLLVEDRELLARMSDVLGKGETPPEASGEPALLRRGPVTIDLGARSVSVLGRPVSLPPDEYQLLAVLVGHANRVVTRTELIGRIWGGPVTAERLERLEASVNGLREKIERDPRHPRHLLQLPGIGFEFRDR